MQKRFSRDVRSLREVFDFTERFFDAESLERGLRFAVNLVVEEVFTNMVKYNRENRNDILLSLERGGDALTISMTDFDVDPFDVTQVPPADVDLPLEQREPGGLGLHLIKQMMDTIHYEYRDRKSRIVMTKRLE